MIDSFTASCNRKLKENPWTLHWVSHNKDGVVMGFGTEHFQDLMSLTSFLFTHIDEKEIK